MTAEDGAARPGLRTTASTRTGKAETRAGAQQARDDSGIAEVDAAFPALPFRVTGLSQKKPTRFDFVPDGEGRAAIAAALGLIELPALRLKGEIRPAGRRDFELVAELTAIAVQPCSVSLAPVEARIAEPVARRYLADFTPTEEEEVEMPEDDSTEPLPEVIDAGAVAVEALALALPLYPRAPGVELGEAVFAAPGTTPMRDEDARPFAGLAALAGKLGKGSTDDGGS